MSEKDARAWFLIVASLAITAAIYAFYLRILDIDLIDILRNNLDGFIFTMLFITSAELVKVVRLYIIFRKKGYRVKLKTIIISRFVGNFLGIITPSSVASEPGRVMSVAMLEGTPMEVVMAGGVLETFYDSFTLAFIALVYSITSLPLSLPIFLSSFFILGIWVLILAGFVFKDSVFRRIFSRINNKMGGKMSKASQKIFSRYSEFAEFTKLGLSSKLSIPTIILTLLSLLLYSFSFLLLSGQNAEITESLLSGLFAYSASYTAQIFPTPGGSGFFEYAISLSMGSSIMAIWRMAFLVVNVLPATLILMFFVRIRRLVEENVKKSLFG
jgi:uncharacterized protein (TIRG00374 family)